MTTGLHTPAFAEGIQYFGELFLGFDTHGATPVIAAGQTGITDTSNPAAAFQTLLYIVADNRASHESANLRK